MLSPWWPIDASNVHIITAITGPKPYRRKIKFNAVTLVVPNEYFIQQVIQ